jgi:hypothetical protein
MELPVYLQSYVAEVSARIAAAPGCSFLIVCDHDSAGFLARHLSPQLAERVRFADGAKVPSEFVPPADTQVIITHADRWEAHRLYARFAAAKKAGAIVALALRDRRLQTHPPGWDGTGIHYTGMFRLAATYCHSLGGGDYAEFGVFDGNTFAIAWHALNGLCDRFFAYDSFAGIIGAMEGETGTFRDGDYFANVETFRANLALAGVDLSRVISVEGPFQSTLTAAPSAHQLERVSVAHIDVDVYEPAKLALDYLGPVLQQGALLLFDDYDQMTASNRKGERRAVREWLAENPDFSLEPYRSYAIFGRSFIFDRRG